MEYFQFMWRVGSLGAGDPSFCSIQRLGAFLLPLDGMLVHRRSLLCILLGFPNNSPVPIYTPGWREALWELSILPQNTTQCPRPGLEPGPIAPRTSALTIRPLCLPQLMEVAKLVSRGITHLSEDLAEKTIEQKPEVINIALELVVVARFHL